MKMVERLLNQLFQPARLQASEGCLSSFKACPAGSWALEGGWTDGWTNERKIFLILQDY